MCAQLILWRDIYIVGYEKKKKEKELERERERKYER